MDAKNHMDLTLEKLAGLRFSYLGTISNLDLEHVTQNELFSTFGLTFDLHVVSTAAGKKVNTNIL